MAYRDVFIYNDWLNRETLVYRKSWKGAWLQAGGKPEVIAHAGGGRAMSQSRGRSFDPVDIEVGPDGALWISSWGREYGAKMVEGQQQNEGRIYRLWPKKMNAEWRPEPKRAKPLKDWSVPELMADLDSGLPVWRVNASEELVRRDDKMVGQLQYALRDHIKIRNAWTCLHLITCDYRCRPRFKVAEFPPASRGYMRQQEALEHTTSAGGSRKHAAGAKPVLRISSICWGLAETDRVVYYSAFCDRAATPALLYKRAGVQHAKKIDGCGTKAIDEGHGCGVGGFGETTRRTSVGGYSCRAYRA